MNRSEIQQRVYNVIRESTGQPIDELSPETHLENDLSLDSLDQTELLMNIEDEFDFMGMAAIPEAVYPTVKDLIDVVERIAEDSA